MLCSLKANKYNKQPDEEYNGSIENRIFVFKTEFVNQHGTQQSRNRIKASMHILIHKGYDSIL